MKRIITLLLLLTTLVVIGCKESSSDKDQRLATEKMVKEANARIGMPGIVNYTEKRMAKMIYELRDKELKTYSYFIDMNGKLHFLCNSIGYGLPASVQYVSPEKIAYSASSSHLVLPQAEPNGLFMPDSLDATYVLCTDKDGKIKPVYTEPKLIVSPFKLKAATSLK